MIDIATETAFCMIGALAAIDAGITWGVVRCDAYSRGQKIAQIILLWLLPFIGPLIVGLVLRSNYDTRFRRRTPPMGPLDGSDLPVGAAGHGDLFDL